MCRLANVVERVITRTSGKNTNSSILIIGAPKRQKERLRCEEYIFGNISLKSNKMVAITTVKKMIPIILYSPKSKTLRKKALNNMIMATLTNKLVTIIVASNLSDFSSNEDIFLSEEWLRCAITFSSEEESEKKAVSEAETKPETINSNMAINSSNSATKEGVCAVIPLIKLANWHIKASESKDFEFS
ncbi:hypothetical protein BSYN_05430 [Bacteroides sedimenti]|uniref:Uncharacterized protein n=1 Tax=Bacteroides sedimenti TaxID=2136147 RepID=A0ABN6Z7E1_9BACE